jgi:capsular polysaccharide biosynthesis protein
MIIGVHGGGLTNCIFSQENTVVIETEPKRDEYYSKLALCAGMKYYSCGEETENIINTIQREIDD